MYRLFLGLSVLWIFSYSAFASAEDEGGMGDYRTDLEVLKDALSKSFTKELEDSPLKPGVGVSLHSIKEDERDWILMDILTGVLLEKGASIMVNNPQVNPDSLSLRNEDYSLYFRIADIKLNYSPRSVLKLFKKSIQRDVRADVLLRLSDNSDGSVVWAKWVKAQNQDVIPVGYNKLLGADESIEHDLVKKEGKLVEALVAVGVISSIVFVAF